MEGKPERYTALIFATLPTRALRSTVVRGVFRYIRPTTNERGPGLGITTLFVFKSGPSSVLVECVVVLLPLRFEQQEKKHQSPQIVIPCFPTVFRCRLVETNEKVSPIHWSSCFVIRQASAVWM